ncbi:MAG: abortive infection system antitoxin AbiGi family protein [Bacteroidia bacterium]
MKERLNLSSNCFLHFTPRLDILVSIIKNGFYPRYCIEKTSYLPIEKVNNLEMAYPIVSFCDIPFSKKKSHISKYGDYGFAKKNGVLKSI